MSASSWKVGVASTPITPAESMWLAGWAARREPAGGKAMELWAKALALEDAQGERAVIVTADLIAIPRGLANAVAARVQERGGLARERILFNASHTHTGPEIRPDKVPFFEIPAGFAARIAPYVTELEERLTTVIMQALERLGPARLRWHRAHANFAANRRVTTGPVDHDVPVLTAHRADGSPLAILFGYACHNLTLPPPFCEFHGDYAGVAQAALEEKFPGATALFVSGAGADQDPSPRGTLELTQAHGQTLAHAVAQKIFSAGREIGAALCVALEEVVLDLQPLPSLEQLEAERASADAPRRRKAEFLLTALAEKRPLATQLVCPVQVLCFGGEHLLIALGGEPVIDYALRFKHEFPDERVWVAGYSNDLFGYLPTRRVQQEGGYEGGRATLWSALPTPLAATSEDRVIGAVHRLVGHVRDAVARPGSRITSDQDGSDLLHSPQNKTI